MKILVVGGAGYIGSHMVKLLSVNDFNFDILDDLSSGHTDAVAHHHLIEGDYGDTQLLEDLFQDTRYDAILHFASSIDIEESVRNPAKYYENNVEKTRVLLEAMKRNNITRIVYSSSAAIYGEPKRLPIDEGHPKNPTNPYGESKLAVEHILKEYDHPSGIQHICLRYFNAAGADPDGELGERHDPETHLIPLLLQAASGRRDNIHIFGTDYDTRDGTCVRDYIHINDLCEAHLLALTRLTEDPQSTAYNLGNGNGYSVREVIDMATKVTGRNIDTIESDRRPGDPAVLIADASLAQKELGWQPKLGSLETIIETAWRWETSLLRA